MKRMIIMAVAALIATMNINAQAGYDTKHEIGITYGAGCNSDIISSFGGALGSALAGSRSENETHFGTIALEYFYHATEVIGVGAIAGFAQNKEDIYFRNSDSKMGKNNDTYITIMPSVKFNWLRKDHFGMYSKLAAGVMFSKFKYESDKNSDNDDSTNETKFNWQASLIGAEVGGANLRAFAELGFGEQGIILGGIRCKF